MLDEEQLQAVKEVLSAIGAHRSVPFDVTDVQTDGVRFHLEVVLHYLRATPVCCGEPGCYVPFLGRRAGDLPGMLACKLLLPVAPRVSMTVHLRHEAGYWHVDVSTGAPTERGIDRTDEYGEDRFQMVATRNGQ